MPSPTHQGSDVYRGVQEVPQRFQISESQAPQHIWDGLKNEDFNVLRDNAALSDGTAKAHLPSAEIGPDSFHFSPLEEPSDLNFHAAQSSALARPNSNSDTRESCAFTPGGSTDANASAASGDTSSPASTSTNLQTDLTKIIQDITSGNTTQLSQDLPQFIQDLLAELIGQQGNSNGGVGTTPADTTSTTNNGTTPTDATATANDGTTTAPNPGNQTALGGLVQSDGTAAPSDLQQVQTALTNGTPQSLLNALGGTTIDVTGQDIGSAGLFDPTTGQITISDNPNVGGGGAQMQEAAVHEVFHAWDQKTGFTNSATATAAALKDTANLPAGALNNLPVGLVDGTTMTAPDGTQFGFADVTAEIATYIAAQDTGDAAVASSGAGATLANLFPNVYAAEKAAIG
jgi:hypothetical protein